MVYLKQRTRSISSLTATSLIIQILMPNTAFEGRSRTRLFQLVTETYADVHLATVTRNYFDEAKGKKYREL